MKVKSIILAAALFALGGSVVRAQDSAFQFGIQGGTTAATLSEAASGGVNGFHAGLSGLVNLPLYFSIQPSVLYEQADTNTGSAAAQQVKTHNITIPVALQWGPDLGLLRPFVQAVPYASFNVGSETSDGSDISINKSQFGVGLGGGLIIWRIQIAVRYNWGLGDWATVKSDGLSGVSGQKFNSFTASAAIFF